MPDDSRPPCEATIHTRVRYVECDPMGVVHHSVYPVWLEIARTELLRQRGMAYCELESQGILFVVARMDVRYRRPARYDDELAVTVRVEASAGVKIEHVYEVHREQTLLATARTTLVCVDREGHLQKVPDALL